MFHRHPLTKCFSIDLKNEEFNELKGHIIHTVEIDFDSNNALFNKSSETDFAIFLHYPNQLMRANDLHTDHLGKRARTYLMSFFIDGLKVIRRRNTNTNPCKEEFVQYDEMIKRQVVEKLGCYPPYWSAVSEFPVCTKQDDLRAALTPTLRGLNSTFLMNFVPPCDQILTFAYTSHFEKEREDVCQDRNDINEENLDYKDLKNDDSSKTKSNSDGWLKREKSQMCNLDTKRFEIVFKNPYYEEILHVKSFSTESWVGNVGGYAGLFLGVAFWQLPDLVEFLKSKLIGSSRVNPS